MNRDEPILFSLYAIADPHLVLVDDVMTAALCPVAPNFFVQIHSFHCCHIQPWDKSLVFLYASDGDACYTRTY